MYQIKETFSGFHDPEVEEGQHWENDTMLAAFVQWRKDTNEEMDRVNRRLDNTEVLARKVMDIMN